MSEQNKAVVRRLFEDHWNSKNAAVVSEFFAPTVSLHTPDGVLTGLDGASSLLQAYATAFPDFHLTIDDLVADGDKVVVRWTFTGTHRGPLTSPVLRPVPTGSSGSGSSPLPRSRDR